MSFVKSAFYAKNLPGWERLLRVLLGGAAILGAPLLAPAPWGWVIAAGAFGMLLSGLIGFCPACALVGRRLDRSK
ncbi:DUF2892 domain-containing protein [Lacibacterium aquatile]|uniref:DUF2892 domain-containing protein n=1 Tax=Lacibacterium aquatile TaxID=1168082 RepID=A0ABW5DN98_9PROT